MEYLKSIQEKFRTSSRIPIKQVEKIICVSIKYVEVTTRGQTLAQMWQKAGEYRVRNKGPIQILQ